MSLDVGFGPRGGTVNRGGRTARNP